MALRPSPPSFLSRFRRDEAGSVTVEAVIMLPILFWCFLACFVFFDAFRTQSVNVKAGYTIGDALSRETDYVTPEYMDFMFKLHGVLTNSSSSRAMRLTSLRYDQRRDRYDVVWSQGRGGVPALSNRALEAMRNRIPIMADNDTALLSETWMAYNPRFAYVGLDAFVFYDASVTRPRFAPRLCWNSRNEGGTAATAIC